MKRTIHSIYYTYLIWKNLNKWEESNPYFCWSWAKERKAPFLNRWQNSCIPLSYQDLKVSFSQHVILEFFQVGEKKGKGSLTAWQFMGQFPNTEAIYYNRILGDFIHFFFSKLYGQISRDSILFHEHKVFNNHCWNWVSWDDKK